jgi:hypothetical protein
MCHTIPFVPMSISARAINCFDLCHLLKLSIFQLSFICSSSNVIVIFNDKIATLEHVHITYE